MLFWALKRSDKFSHEEIEDLENKRLKKLVLHAYNNISFWRKRFDYLGISPNNIGSVSDLARLPVLTKEELQEAAKSNPGSCFDTKLPKRRLLMTMTSGSTGRPLTVAHDKKYLAITNAAINLLTWRRCGVKFFRGRRVIVVNMTAKINEAVYFQKIVTLALNSVRNRIDNLISLLQDNEPVLLCSSAYQLRCLARELRIKNWIIVKFGSILIADETLSRAETEELEKIFGARIFTNYGQREVQNIGTECHFQDGLHIKPQANIVEILDENDKPAPAGVSGNIVVTSLDNYAMPFIRYKTGDLGYLLPDPCPCGINSPRMKFEGRGSWKVYLKDGSILPFDFVKSQLFSYSLWLKIKQFQFVQEADYGVRLYIIPETTWTKADDDEIEGAAAPLGLFLDTVIVFEIGQSDARKPREFVSKIEGA